MIIGLCGRAGSGKSSVANHLVEKFGATKIAFADPLKRMAMQIWKFTEEQVFGPAEVKEQVDPRWGFSPRQALQFLGTEVCRTQLGKDVWVDALLRRAQQSHRTLWVVEDVRFVNEVYRLTEEGSLVIRLSCTDSMSVADQSHASEAEVDIIPANLVVDVEGSRAEGLVPLFARVDQRVESWLAKAGTDA